MSRCLTIGIPVEISVYDNKKWIMDEEDFKTKKSKIPSKMNEMIDLSFYNQEEDEDGYIFKIKKEILENNIHDLIRETNPLLHMDILTDLKYLFTEFEIKKANCCSEYKINNINEFTKENYPLELVTYPKNYKDMMYAGHTYIQNKNDKNDQNEKLEVRSTWDTFQDLLLGYEDENLAEHFTVRIKFANIWVDVWTDWASFMELKLLNTFSRKIFKTPLSKTMIFYIDG